jgi:hypothetical protein
MLQNNIYKQHQKIQSLKNRAIQNDIMKKPQHILIVDIVANAKVDNKTLTTKEINDKIKIEVGNEFTESVIRHAITNLIEKEILITVVKKGINHIALGKDVNVKEFVPLTQLIPIIITTLIGSFLILYDVFVIHTRFNELGYGLILYNCFLMFSNYIEYEFDLKSLKFSFLESMKKFKIFLKKVKVEKFSQK